MDRFKGYLAASGRLLLALMFALSGTDKLANMQGTAGYMASAGLPSWPVLALAAGLFEVAAAVALAVGWKARWAALVLAMFTLVASVLFHSFCGLPPGAQLMFLKNLSVAGGMLVIAAFGAGPFSADARHAAHRSVA